jgi:transposase
MNRRQTIPPQQKYTIKQFQAEFPDDDACLDYLMHKRFPGAVALCTTCKVDRKHYRVTGRTCYACPVCGSHLFPLAGTIFHKSSTSLTTWFYVIKLMTSTRVGHLRKADSAGDGRDLQMRLADDEAGPATHGRAHQTPGRGRDRRSLFRRRGQQQAAAPQRQGQDARSGHRGAWRQGLGARHGRGDERRYLADCRRSPTARAMVYADPPKRFRRPWMGQNHKLAPSTTPPRQGYAHTNTIDGFWALVKRGIHGVYYQVGAKYLQSYLTNFPTGTTAATSCARCSLSFWSRRRRRFALRRGRRSWLYGGSTGEVQQIAEVGFCAVWPAASGRNVCICLLVERVA